MRASALTAFFVGLALLVAAALHWGPDRVERDLELRTIDAITASGAGVQDLSVSADGRVLTVRGVVADGAARDALLAAVGQVSGVERVEDGVDVAPPPSALATTTTTPGVTPLGLGSLRAQVGGGKVRLQGAIPNQPVRVALVRRLLKKFGPLLADELQLGGDAAPDLVEPFGRLVERGALSLSDGSFVLSERTLVLLGATTATAEPGELLALARRTSRRWIVVNALRSPVPTTVAPTTAAPTTSAPEASRPGGSTTSALTPPATDWQGRIDDLLTNAPLPLDPSGARLPAIAGLVLEQVATLVVDAEPAAVEIVVREPAPPVESPSDDDGSETEVRTSDPETARAEAEAAAAAASRANAARARTRKQAALVVQALRDHGLTDVPMAATGAGVELAPPGDPGLEVRVVLRYPPPPTTTTTETTVVRRRRATTARR